MFRRLSGDRYRSLDSLKVSSMVSRVRAWRVASRDFEAADDLLHEIDQLEREYPRLSNRLECIRATLWAAFEESRVAIG